MTKDGAKLAGFALIVLGVYIILQGTKRAGF